MVSKKIGVLSSTVVTYVMVGLLIVGAYFIGVYKTKSEVISQPPVFSDQAGDEYVGDEFEAPTVLSDEDWSAIVDGAVTMGSSDAPATIVEFTDFQCPFCAKYNDETFSQIVDNYIENGDVFYVFRDLPLSFHPNAISAAIAARCAGKQGDYIGMRDALFENQEEWSAEEDTTASFVTYASGLGLDSNLFSSCLNDKSVADDVDFDSELAGQVGANGTPAFFINRSFMSGAQPYANFEEMIEDLIE